MDKQKPCDQACVKCGSPGMNGKFYAKGTIVQCQGGKRPPGDDVFFGEATYYQYVMTKDAVLLHCKFCQHEFFVDVLMEKDHED